MNKGGKIAMVAEKIFIKVMFFLIFKNEKLDYCNYYSKFEQRIF